MTDRLHRGIVQAGREAHILTRSLRQGSEETFNSSLEGNTRRAIDLREGEAINEAAFKQLIRAAVAANSAALAQRATKKK